ncbi:MAG TPA: hypothetical protein PLB46_03390 [Chitinophagales bacterium]|nr:hypothetical protein [Chitinophagales bacterium]
MSRLITMGVLIYILGVQTLSAQYPLDETFGDNGIRFVEWASDMVVLNNGNILLIGSDLDPKKLNVWAFSERGNPLASFGEDGALKLQFSEGCVFRMAIPAENNEWYMWLTYPVAYYYRDSVIRFNEHGERILDYGINGAAPLPTLNQYIDGNMCILSTGELVITGELKITDPYVEGRFVYKYTKEGKLDTQFGDEGMVVLNNFTPWVTAPSILIERYDGSLVVGNTIDNGATYFVEIRVIDKWGVPVNSFGQNGVITLKNNASETRLLSYWYDFKSQVLYVHTTGYNDDIRIWQLNWDGELNAFFGTEGYQKSKIMDGSKTMYKVSDGTFYFTGIDFVNNYLQRDIKIWKTNADLDIIPWSEEESAPTLNLQETPDKIQASDEYEIRSVMLHDGSILILTKTLFYGTYAFDYPSAALIKVPPIDQPRTDLCPLLSVPVLYHDQEQSFLQLTLDPLASGDFTFSVTDMMGRTVITHYSLDLAPGISNYTYPIPLELPNGMYLLTIHADDCATGIKFMK